jgi:hypothetical protein
VKNVKNITFYIKIFVLEIVNLKDIMLLDMIEHAKDVILVVKTVMDLELLTVLNAILALF